MANPILLDPSVVIRNVDLTPFTTIMLRGGEPLVLRQCLEYMDYLEQVGKRYTILTNGILIDDERAHRLAEHAHSVIVSLNGATKNGHESVNRGSRFERVVENVQRMRRARDSLGSEMNLTGHMTITTSNLHEVPLFLRLFREFGFDRVNFGYVKETVPLYLATHLEFAERLKEETSAAMREVNEGDVDALRLKLLGLWRDARIGEGSSSVVELPIVQMSPSSDQVVLAKNDGSSASQRVIGDPVLDVLREIDHDYRVVAFIRHSERSRTPSPADPSMDNVPLTPRGVELAHQFGGELPDFGHASVSHSSIIRAIQTATEIDAGFRESHPISKMVLVGKDPIFSVIYRGTIDKKLRDAIRAGLRGQAFSEMWLDGKVPGTIMRPATETIARFLADVDAMLRKAPPGSIRIHVGHDREIEVVRTALLGGRLSDYPMMDFLDGLVFYSQGEASTRARWRDRVVEVTLDSSPRITVTPEDISPKNAV
jgi:broad specificity phosphatase PhoE